MSPGNRLADARSPYLRDAAEQPVHWEQWGADAFERARREDKPVLLDVGAVWCHWCHVMDHESYESPEIARVINEKFVAVKVDRDERPDVDARYQKLVGAITGQGGWPLTAFLTPDGDVFYGGTYFPPRDARGMAGFPRVLDAVHDAWTTKREDVLKQATALSRAVADRVLTGAPDAGAGDVTEDAVARGVNAFLGEFDAVNGGFGSAPKFPHPSAITLLVRRLTRGAGDAERVRGIVRDTLAAMARGGMHDHVGGGFHRYSVDAEWKVPHFEKMLYDNAELLRNYALGARVVDAARFAPVARDTVRFLMDVLAQPDGGFGGSQDADVGPGDDGDFFTWTLDELREAVPDPERQRALALRFNVNEQGEMHHDPARNVLRVTSPESALADALGKPEDEVLAVLDAGLQDLRAARAERETPFVDPTVYTNWNGMAASALLWHAGFTGDARAKDAALRTIDRLIADAFTDDRGFRHLPTPDALTGVLDDNAQMLQALLDAWDHTGARRYLDVARRVGDLLLDAFWSEDAHAFLSIAPALSNADGPEAPPDASVTDSPSPSAGGVAALSLLRLEALTGDARYADTARAAVTGALPLTERYGLFTAQMLLAADALVHPGAHVVIAATGADADAMRAVALTAPDPARAVTVVDPDAPEDVPQIAADAFHATGAPAAVVCVGTRCLAPADSADALKRRLTDALGGTPS